MVTRVHGFSLQLADLLSTEEVRIHIPNASSEILIKPAIHRLQREQKNANANLSIDELVNPCLDDRLGKSVP